jgi:hypothetical protein
MQLGNPGGVAVASAIQIQLDLVLKVSAQERWSCQWCD